MPKKCFHCENMLFCAAYHETQKMAGLLNNIMRVNDLGETGFEVIINTLAHDCVRFKKIEREANNV